MIDPSSLTSGSTSRGRAVTTTLIIFAVWAIWFLGFYGIAWLVLMILVLPKIIGILKLTFRGLNVPVTDDAVASAESFLMVAIERLTVAGIILMAALVLMWASEISIAEIGSGDTTLVKLVRGITHAGVVLLLADLCWHLISAGIDNWLNREIGSGYRDVARQARLRTLVSVMRSGMLIVVGMIAAMMALSSFGIDVGPLIAGAGVVGVALGFGAQTVIKDIISGIFYLIDDAFRVGEYIQSGSYKGTVESFSLRSVRLRHHRGSVYTVPFSALGAVQNMSRDWVLEKINLNLTYDTDLPAVKKIVKAIGKELAQDEEFAPAILEPLKMQGVEAFGDYAIQIRLKFKCKPGDTQFMIKRRAHAMLKQAFDENGIKFAFPKVEVADAPAGPIHAYAGAATSTASRAPT